MTFDEKYEGDYNGRDGMMDAARLTAFLYYILKGNYGYESDA